MESTSESIQSLLRSPLGSQLELILSVPGSQLGVESQPTKRQKVSLRLAASSGGGGGGLCGTIAGNK